METLTSHVPPGFRFHPTDEELVDYYLRKKINSRRIDLDVIKDVDLYKIEPWDLQELCRIGTEEQSDWYFFSHKDKKYPTGTRTNRATAAGFWKATGRDKAIYAKHELIGMRKTLVFYKGRAPNGQKSDWIMHEYRLETDENGASQEEGWVVCRVFKKRITTVRKVGEHEQCCWYDDHQTAFMNDFDSPKQPSHQPDHHHHHHQHQQQQLLHHSSYNLPFPCKKELDHHQLQYQTPHHHDHHHFLQLPLLQSPKLFQSSTSAASPYGLMLDPNQTGAGNLQPLSLTQELHSMIFCNNNNNGEQAADQVTDWRVLDKFVASQLSQEDGTNVDEDHYSNDASEMNAGGQLNNDESAALENVSTSASSSQIELWK